MKFICLLMAMLLMFSPISFAAEDVVDGGSFSLKSYFTNQNNHELDIDNLSSQLASAMLIIGYGCAVIMVLYIGIRYTIARPAEKAQLKIQFTYLIIGVVVLVSGTTVLGIVAGAFNSVFN